MCPNNLGIERVNMAMNKINKNTIYTTLTNIVRTLYPP